MKDHFLDRKPESERTDPHGGLLQGFSALRA